MRAPAALACVALAGCAGAPVPPGTGGDDARPPPEDWTAPYLAARARGGPVWTLDAAASQLRVYAFRGGRLPQAGHNHVIVARDCTGYAQAGAAPASALRFDLECSLAALEVDPPGSRAGLGAAFASEVDADAAASTRAHMLGGNGLQAQQHPAVHVRSLEVAGEAPKVAARVAVTLHGQTRTQWVALEVRGLPESLDVGGSLVLRQSDFGVTPYTVLGGVLAVQDPVVVEFHLRGR